MAKQPNRPSKSAAGGATAQDKAWSLPNDRIEAALLSGEHGRELDEVLGEALHEELRQLARQAASRAVRGGPRVLILPGIMGSKLGIPGRFFDDVYWFDPMDWSFGVGKKLALNGLNRIRPLGVFLLYYLRMKFRLRLDGLDADFHAFDWRRSVKELGAELAERILDGAAPEVFLVAHSMGGLVARSAIKALPDAIARRRKAARNYEPPNVARLIMLGTPNYGSFSPVQVFRAAHSTLGWAALADVTHSKEELVNAVFSTFPSLYEMLPSPERYKDLDLLNSDHWPKSGPQLSKALLKQARPMQDWLAPADDRFFLIAGFNQATAVAVTEKDGEFVYAQSNAGDGTVPWDFCRLDGAKTFFVEESHGSLPNNLRVIRAVAELIHTGRTERLPTTPPALRRAAVETVTDTELQERTPDQKRKPGEVRAADWREFLRGFADPPAVDATMIDTVMPAGPAPGILVGGEATARTPWVRLTVGRVQQHRLELFLARGDITDVDARAYVFGLFREVAPSGPARAVDELLDGAITEFTQRRMFSGAVGEVFLMPAHRRRLCTEMILFAGLGSFDRFNDDVQQVTAENVMRVFVRTGVEEFATVLMGASSGMTTSRLLTNLAQGFVRGKLDADVRRNFRRIILCERDADRYEEIRAEAYRLAGTDLFKDIELSLTEIHPAPLRRAVVVPDGVTQPTGGDPMYLLVRYEALPDEDTQKGRKAAHAGRETKKGAKPAGRKMGRFCYHTSLLTGDGKAALMTETTKPLDQDKLDVVLKKIESPGFANTVAAFGDDIASLAIPGPIGQAMHAAKNRHLVVVHDAESSRLPWETLRFAGSGKKEWTPAIEEGMSRRYLADNLSVAKYLAERQEDGVLDMLLIVNPTGDLGGAEAEGQRIEAMFKDNPAVRIEPIYREKATRRAVLAALGSGRFDVVHYAGHASFDAGSPSRSGLLCHGYEVATGADMSSLRHLPALAVFNACESARMNGKRRPDWKQHPVRQRIIENVGLAEALLRGGIANYVGTYWPVGDDSASLFAQVFYTALLSGESIGSAVVKSRKQLQPTSVDWADYIHYGDFHFVLKRRGE